MRRAMLAAAVLALIAATAGRARAGMIVDFSYSGRGGPDFAGLIATGTGSFAFAGDPSTVGLKDLTSFAFTLSENTNNTATFDLADLTSFSASVGSGRALTSLTLGTGSVQGSDPTTYPREFTLASLDPSGASTSFVVLGVPFSQTEGTATITSVTPVPEPSAFALAVAGALIAAGARSRRRRARAGA